MLSLAIFFVFGRWPCFTCCLVCRPSTPTFSSSAAATCRLLVQTGAAAIAPRPQIGKCNEVQPSIFFSFFVIPPQRENIRPKALGGGEGGDPEQLCFFALPDCSTSEARVMHTQPILRMRFPQFSLWNDLFVLNVLSYPPTPSSLRCAPTADRRAAEHAAGRVCHRRVGHLAACRVSRPPLRRGSRPTR